MYVTLKLKEVSSHVGFLVSGYSLSLAFHKMRKLTILILIWIFSVKTLLLVYKCNLRMILVFKNIILLHPFRVKGLRNILVKMRIQNRRIIVVHYFFLISKPSL